MYTKIGNYPFQMTVCCPGSNPTRKTDSHLKRIASTNCCIHTVLPPDDGPRYARNMQTLTKYTKNMLCIKLVFLYAIVIFISRFRLGAKCACYLSHVRPCVGLLPCISAVPTGRIFVKFGIEEFYKNLSRNAELV